MEQIVTKIEELSGRRRLVYINGEQAFALYSTEVRRYGITEGKALAQEDLEQLRKVVKFRFLRHGFVYKTNQLLMDLRCFAAFHIIFTIMCHILYSFQICPFDIKASLQTMPESH